MPATALIAAWVLLAAGCGGTLEGKYRRGQLNSTTTTTAPRAPATTGTAPVPPTTTATSVPTSGNASDHRGRGEAGAFGAGGTIEGSAARRAIAPPLGGRHR
jgi:hypothetical protein